MVKSLRYAVTLKAAPLDVDMEASGTMLVENKNSNETSTIVLGSIYPFPFLAKPTLSTRLHNTIPLSFRVCLPAQEVGTTRATPRQKRR